MTGEKVLLTLTAPAAAAITADRLFCYKNSSGNLAISGAGDGADGVSALRCTAAGDKVSYEVGEYLVVASSGAINAGDIVGSDANGKAVAWTSGKKIGKAESAASGGFVKIKKFAAGSQGDGDMGILAADGAIAIPANDKTFVITKGTAAALTLADPTAGVHDGVTLTIISATAAAHTVSNAAGSGFNGGGATADVATFGAAKGNNIVLVAYQGDWYVRSSVGATLG